MTKTVSRLPNLAVFDVSGAEHRLEEYRRRSHVVLVVEEAGGPARWAVLRRRLADEAQRWTWLQAAFLRPIHPPAGLAPGAYLLSRWGDLLQRYPGDAWSLDQIEKDILTFEAQDCCDLSKAP